MSYTAASSLRGKSFPVIGGVLPPSSDNQTKGTP